MKDNRLELVQCCPRCGAAGLSTRDKNARECGACGFRLYFNPAAAVGVILLDAAGQTLLICRAKDPDRGKLGLPGGFVDGGETAEEALRRETREEVGLEIEALEFLVTRPNQYQFRGVIYDTLDLFFISRIPSFERARAQDEVAGLVVCRPEEVDLEQIAFVSVREAFRHFLKTRAQ